MDDFGFRTLTTDGSTWYNKIIVHVNVGLFLDATSGGIMSSLYCKTIIMHLGTIVIRFDCGLFIVTNCYIKKLSNAESIDFISCTVNN